MPRHNGQSKPGNSALNQVASLSLKLREVGKVSGSACEEVRQNIGMMLCMSRQLLQSDVKEKLNDASASAQLVNSVCNVLSKSTPSEDACSVLTMEQDINKYVESNFPYVDPIQYMLGDSGTQQDSMQYISILATLQQLLQNDEIFSAVVHSHQSIDGRQAQRYM